MSRLAISSRVSTSGRVATSGRSSVLNRVPTVLSGAKALFFSELGVSSSGGSITNWADQMNNIFSFTASGSTKPTIVANQQNGYQSIRFDGISQFLTSNNTTQTIKTPTALTAFYVFKPISIDSDNPTIYLNDTVLGDSGAYTALILRNNVGGITCQAYNYDGSVKVAVQNIVVGATSVVSMAHGGGTIAISINGAAETSTATGATQVMTGGIRMGLAYSSTNYANMDLFAVVLYDSALSSGEKNTIITYLKYKYAIA